MSVARGTQSSPPFGEPLPAARPVAQTTHTRDFFLPTIAGVCGRGIPDEITFSRGLSVDTSDCARVSPASRCHTTAPGCRTSTRLWACPEAGRRSSSGTVPLSELLAAVPNLDGRAASRAIQAMALLAGGAAAEQLLGFARDTMLPPEARRMAVTWFDIVAGADGGDALAETARNPTTEVSVREQAFIALGDRGTALAVQLAQQDSTFRRSKLNRFARTGQ